MYLGGGPEECVAETKSPGTHEVDWGPTEEGQRSTRSFRVTWVGGTTTHDRDVGSLFLVVGCVETNLLKFRSREGPKSLVSSSSTS